MKVQKPIAPASIETAARQTSTVRQLREAWRRDCAPNETRAYARAAQRVRSAKDARSVERRAREPTRQIRRAVPMAAGENRTMAAVMAAGAGRQMKRGAQS